jgi:hypothetical protein
METGEEVGPAPLPNYVLPEVSKQAKTEEERRREWNLVKAGISLAEADKPLQRDNWMTELPTPRATLNLGKMQKSVTRFRYELQNLF